MQSEAEVGVMRPRAKELREPQELGEEAGGSARAFQGAGLPTPRPGLRSPGLWNREGMNVSRKRVAQEATVHTRLHQWVPVAGDAAGKNSQGRRDAARPCTSLSRGGQSSTPGGGVAGALRSKQLLLLSDKKGRGCVVRSSVLSSRLELS